MLLAFTPRDRTRRIVWMARRRSMNAEPMQWVEVRRAEASRLKHEPQWHVRRLVVEDGNVVEEHAE